jgi:hypothetical protein
MEWGIEVSHSQSTASGDVAADLRPSAPFCLAVQEHSVICAVPTDCTRVDDECKRRMCLSPMAVCRIPAGDCVDAARPHGRMRLRCAPSLAGLDTACARVRFAHSPVPVSISGLSPTRLSAALGGQPDPAGRVTEGGPPDQPDRAVEGPIRAPRAGTRRRLVQNLPAAARRVRAERIGTVPEMPVRIPETIDAHRPGKARRMEPVFDLRASGTDLFPG